MIINFSFDNHHHHHGLYSEPRLTSFCCHPFFILQHGALPCHVRYTLQKGHGTTHCMVSSRPEEAGGSAATACGYCSIDNTHWRCTDRIIICCS
jgi:hypothetical protein